MDKNPNIIKLDSDNEELDGCVQDSSTVDLTSDNSMSETVEIKLPAAIAVKESIACDDIEEGEVEEAQEAAEICEPTSSKQTLAFEIKFSNEAVFKEYGHKILESLEKALNVAENNATFAFGISNAENTTVSSINAYIAKQSYANHLDMELSDCEEAVSITEVAPERRKSENREESPDIGLNSLFTIDTSGSKKLDTKCVPSYKRSIKDVLNEESSACKRKKLEEEENECQRVRTTAACFNCGVAGHSLRECDKPRNNARINRAKMARKQERYHIDIEQRFGHLRPGKISDKLQAALGLKRGELPFFFYRMRKLGYPPGWLEEAKVINSGIALFNSEGGAVMGSEEENSQESEEIKYDISKIIDYPGFNVDPGPNFYDDYKHHNVPPLSRHQRKEEFIRKLGSNVIKGYKHKRLKSLPQTTNAIEPKTSILDNADMEIEDNVADDENVVFTRPPPPPEPANDIKPPPPPPNDETSTSAPKNESTSATSPQRTCSPTLDYLEERKQKLLAELKSGLCDAESFSINTAEESLALETSNSEANANEIAEDSIANEEHAAEPTTPTSNETTSALEIIKESHMGTPVLHFSPYEKLPAGDNFKVGVSDVINFENLPDSTGKYEQMKKVIKKVRHIVTKLHNDEDD